MRRLCVVNCCKYLLVVNRLMLSSRLCEWGGRGICGEEGYKMWERY